MFECCCIDDGEGPEFFSEKKSKARKNYKCIECGKEIKKGDTYERASGKWSGDVTVYHTCNTCSNIRKDFFSCGYVFGELYTHLQECGWTDRELGICNDNDCENCGNCD